jgi:hypothetical protein
MKLLERSKQAREQAYEHVHGRANEQVQGERARAGE